MMNKSGLDNQTVELPEERGGPFSGWILAPITLILVGAIFLLRRTMGFELPDRWWALFLLIPAAGFIFRAWRRSSVRGEWSRMAIRNLITGLLLVLLAGVFFLVSSWSLVWPIVLVLIGLAILLQLMYRG